jgi:hypothetical protein
MPEPQKGIREASNPNHCTVKGSSASNILPVYNFYGQCPLLILYSVYRMNPQPFVLVL